MKKIILAVLCVVVIVGLVFARSSSSSSSSSPSLASPSSSTSFEAPSAAPSDADAIRQICRDWADATKAIDVNRLSQIFADDWRGVGSSGKIKSKESVLSYVQTRDYRLDSFEFGPMDVKVFGNVGVVQGSITQTFIKDGQHTEFKSAWMDVFEKRGGKWVVVRSQSARLE